MKVRKILNKRLGRGCSKVDRHLSRNTGFLLATVLWGVILGTVFISCDNFLNGSPIVDQLEKEIKYANAASYKVRVSADNGTGVINAGSGDNDMKVTDRLVISFSKDKGYKFLRWEAVQKDDVSVSMADYVEFEDATALETKVKLVKAPDADILIKPLCTATLGVTGKYPADKTEGTERDSTIKFVFTAPLSENNDLSRISITISGTTADGRNNFQDPLIEEDQLIIMAKVENRIEVTEGSTKTVTVTIPADFTYVSDSGEIEIGEEITHTYTINSTTCDKTFITYGTNDEEGGTVKVNGLASTAVSQQYSIGESVTVSFKVADGYEFLGWECSDEGSVLIQKPDEDVYDENGFNATTQTASVTLLIINQSKNVTFKAVTQKIPTVPLKIYLPIDGSGVLKVNGVVANGEEKSYRKGDEISLTFKKNDAYKFLGWDCSDSEEAAVKLEAEVTKSTDAYGLDPDTKTATAKITILGGSEIQISISPKAPEIDKSYIAADSPYGRFSMNITNSYKEGDSQVLGFTSDPDYQFIRWRILKVDADNTKTEVENGTYIQIDKPKEANTNFNLVKAIEAGTLEIEPVCAERPKVVSATPADDSNGVYRDRTIIVKFNKEMDESSIYWTADELRNKGISYEKAFKVDEEKSDTEALYYAYWDGVNASSYCYKNIQITKYTDSSVNFLQYYGIPKFDEGNARVLRLPTKISIAPPSATDILVTIKKDFCYEEDTKKITLSSDYGWSYYTNGNIDNDAPEFMDDDNNGFTVTLADNPGEGEEEQKNYNKDNPAAETSADCFDPEQSGFDVSIFKTLNSKNKKLWVRGSFTDVGSGPGSLKWEVHKVNTKYYPCSTENDIIQNGQIKLNIIGSNASVNATYENNNSFDIGGESVTLSDITEEGLYRIDFIASDKNERTATKSYYFIYDETAPEVVSKNLISNSRTSKTEETVSWQKPSSPDFAKVRILQYDTNGNDLQKNEFTFTADKLSNTFSNLTDQTKYKYRFYSIDYAGNESQLFTDYTDDNGPEKSKVSNYSTVSKDAINVKVSNFASDCAKTVIYGVTFADDDVNLISNLAGNSATHTITVVDYDYSGNTTIHEESITAIPAPGMIYYSDGYWSKEYVSGKTPLGVVCDTSDLSAVRIWDLTEATGYCWGKNDDPCSNEVLTQYWNKEMSGRNTASGLEWYNYIKGNKSFHINYQNGSKDNCHTIWYYLENVKNKNSPVTWYIPGITEFNPIINNYYDIKSTFDLLSSEWRPVTFFTSEKPYWTGCPRYKKPYANAVMLNKSNAGIYENIASNTGLTLYLSGENKEDNWYFKDEYRCEKSGNKADLITHAMAQVDLR